VEREQAWRRSCRKTVLAIPDVKPAPTPYGVPQPSRFTTPSLDDLCSRERASRADGASPPLLAHPPWLTSELSCRGRPPSSGCHQPQTHPEPHPEPTGGAHAQQQQQQQQQSPYNAYRQQQTMPMSCHVGRAVFPLPARLASAPRQSLSGAVARVVESRNGAGSRRHGQTMLGHTPAMPCGGRSSAQGSGMRGWDARVRVCLPICKGRDTTHHHATPPPRRCGKMESRRRALRRPLRYHPPLVGARWNCNRVCVCGWMVEGPVSRA